MQTLNNDQAEQVSGGFIQYALVAIAVYDAVSDFYEGFKEGLTDGK